MKRRIVIFILILCLLPALTAHAADCSAEAMILYEPRTGTILAEKNADAEKLVASTTKIMTAMVVLEHCALDEMVTVSAAQTAVEGSVVYLVPGQQYTVEQLLYGLLLASGNDAALALAEHTAGSAEAFSDLMNAKCTELGLQHSHFVNPHGLDADEHYSSARDLAVITAAAMENPDFCRIFPQLPIHPREEPTSITISCLAPARAASEARPAIPKLPGGSWCHVRSEMGFVSFV